MFVSHDRYFIRKFASSVCELEDGKLLCFDGDYESFREYRRIIEEEKEELLPGKQSCQTQTAKSKKAQSQGS